MATNAQINILINAAQSAKTLGELDKALGDINAELKNVEVGSDAFKTLKTQADATAKSINQINISGFESRLKGFEATSKTISSSLAFATGSMALFGAESEETSKALARVQGALAISTAFKDFAEAQKAADESGKGLNRTLLGNPFILILGLLLPLLTQMDSFKDIMSQLSGIAGQLFEALKPLLDAFMMLLNSVLKALLPIITTIANVLIKSLRPIFDILAKVLKGLNPLFEQMGKFLTENEFLVKVLTRSIQLALLPLTLLAKGIEALGDANEDATEKIDDASEALKRQEAAIEATKNARDALNVSLDKESDSVDNEVARRQLEIEKLEAVGNQVDEVRRKKKELFDYEVRERKRLLKDLDKEIAYQKAVGNETTDLQKRRVALYQAEQKAIINRDNFERQENEKRQQNQKNTTDKLIASQKQLENSYLALRDIQRDLAEEFVSPEQERFFGFFADFRKRLGDVVKNIDTSIRPQLQTFIDFYEKTFLDEEAFDNFLKNYQATTDQLSTSNDEITLTLVNFNEALEKVFEETDTTGFAADVSKGFNLVRKSTEGIRKLITTDALVYDQIIEGTIGDTQQIPIRALNALTLFFTDAQKKAAEGFDFATAPILLSFEQVKKEIDKQLKDINALLEQELTFTERERLKTLKLSFQQFLQEYKQGIKDLTDEDISNLLRTPLEKTLGKVFDDVRAGSAFALIEFNKLSEALSRTEGFDEFIDPVRKSLINLGVEAEKVDKIISKVIFDLRSDTLTALQAQLERESQAISVSIREQEKARREASSVRISILQNEIDRADDLATTEIRRYTKLQTDRTNETLKILDKQIAEGLISEEEGAKIRNETLLQLDNDLLKKRTEVNEQTAKVIAAIERDINDEIKNESLRRLQRFTDGFTEIISQITDAAQIASDLLNNLTEQQLINIQSVFEAQVGQLEALKNQGLLTQREYDFERLKAQERYEMRRKRLEKEAWERNYAIQLGQAIINTAVAVSQALAQFPGPPFTIPNSIVAGVLGGAQVAVIASQPKPKFREGGLVSGNAPGDSDTVLAQLSSGEFVMNSMATKKFLPLLKQLNQYNLPTIGGRETVASPAITDLGQAEPVRAYVVLDELNEKNETLSRIQNDNTFFRAD